MVVERISRLPNGGYFLGGNAMPVIPFAPEINDIAIIGIFGTMTLLAMCLMAKSN